MESPRNPGTLRAAALAACLAPAAYLLRFGYGFGYSDQDEFLPWLVHRLNPDLLSLDWFVRTQEAAFNVRSGLMAVLEPLAAVLGIRPAVDLLYAATWVLLAGSVFAYAHGVTRSRAGAVAVALITLAIVPRWTLGGNAMPSALLVPSMTAWALAIAALALHARSRPWIAGVLLGLAAWLQPLVALTVTGALLAAGIFQGRGPGPTLRSALALAVPALLLAVPFGIRILLGSPVGGAAMDGPAAVDLLTRFRAPHHYLPGAFPAADWLQSGILIAAGAASLAALRDGRSADARRHAAGLFVAAALGLGIGLIGTQVSRLALLQPFRITVLTGMVSVTWIVAVTIHLVRVHAPTVLDRLDRVAGHPAAALAGLAIVALTLLAAPSRPSPDPSLDAAADWIRVGTTPTDVIAVPPSATGFRFRSRRAVVVTFKAVPFSADGVSAWYRRLGDVAPGADRAPAGIAAAETLSRLDAAYERMTADELDTLAGRHDVSFLVRRTALSDPIASGWEEVARPGAVVVYRRLPPTTP